MGGVAVVGGVAEHRGVAVVESDRRRTEAEAQFRGEEAGEQRGHGHGDGRLRHERLHGGKARRDEEDGGSGDGSVPGAGRAVPAPSAVRPTGGRAPPFEREPAILKRWASTRRLSWPSPRSSARMWTFR